MGLLPPEFCDFNPGCPLGRSCFIAGRSRAIAVSIPHRACSIADCLTLLQRACPDPVETVALLWVPGRKVFRTTAFPPQTGRAGTKKCRVDKARSAYPPILRDNPSVETLRLFHPTLPDSDSLGKPRQCLIYDILLSQIAKI